MSVGERSAEAERKDVSPFLEMNVDRSDEQKILQSFAKSKNLSLDPPLILVTKSLILRVGRHLRR